MDIEFKNIGFIKSGKIKTNKISIIFGPNNVGKTYLSYSAYAAMKHFNEKINNKINIPESISNELIDKGSVKYDISEIISDKLINSANTEISSLLPAFFKNDTGLFSSSKINVTDSTLRKKIMDATASIPVSLTDNMILAINKRKDEGFVTFHISSVNGGDDKSDGKIKLNNKEANDYLNTIFKFFFLNSVLDSAANDPFIITSERTGISLFQKEIDANRNDIVNKMAYGEMFKLHRKNLLKSYEDILRKKVAKFSEPINHNINVVREFPENKNALRVVGRMNNRTRIARYEKIIESLESLTGGKYSTKDDETIFTVKCESGNDISMPLSLSSASNKALFLLDIYIRNYITPDCYLVIDEPELNLHPQNQIKMAELLVRLSHYGVKILITTHSDFIVKEINNRIMASAIKDSELLASLNYEDIDVISQKDVNAFTIGNDGIITDVGHNDFGLNAYLFDDVIAGINEKSEKLYDYLVKEKEQ